MFRNRATKNRSEERAPSPAHRPPGGRRQLEHALARLDQAQLLAGDLLDGVGIGAEPVHRRRRARSVSARRARDLALEALDLVLHAARRGPGSGRRKPRMASSDDRAERGQRAARGRLTGRGSANTARPGHTAAGPSSSSMRRSWLYFAVRSPRASEPVLIWPAFTPTARSAMKVSSVSPERWEMTVP